MRGSRRSLAHFLPPSPPSPNERKDKERNEQKVFSPLPDPCFLPPPMSIPYIIFFFLAGGIIEANLLLGPGNSGLWQKNRELERGRLAGLLDVIDSPGEGKGKHNSLAVGEEEGRKIEDLLWPNPTWKIKRVFSPSFPFLRGKLKGKQGRAEGGAPSAGECFCFRRSCFIGKQSKAIEGKEGEENPQHTADSQFAAAEEEKSFLHPPPPTKKRRRVRHGLNSKEVVPVGRGKRGLRSDGRRKEEEEEEAVAASSAGERRRENSIRVRSVLIAAVEEGGREGAVGIQGEGIAKIS